jgi:lipid-binding SYLF domain-containing protein
MIAQTLRTLFTGVAVLTAVAAAHTAPAFAQAAVNENVNLVAKAAATVDTFRANPDMGPLRNLLSRAKGIVVVPQLIKAGFIIGGEGGSAVMLTQRNGNWSAPAFYTVAGGSIGLQAGAQASEVILVLMTDKAVNAVLKNNVKLGADIGIAAGPVGAGLEASTTTNLSNDVYAFALSKGLFGGIALEGSVLAPDTDANRAYYGKPVTPADVLAGTGLADANSANLRTSIAALAKAQ